MSPWRKVVLALLVPAAAGATTYHVPADYTTIQAALDRCSVGDSVLVAPGTYSDWTLTPGGITAEVAQVPDGVVLTSEGGTGETTIDLAPLEGAASSYAAFGCSHHDSGLTVIDGFRVIGFPPTSNGVAMGYCEHIEVRNCVFEAAGLPDPDIERGGISMRLSDLHVSNCMFIRCSAHVGAGVSQVGGTLTVEGCTFIECQNQGIRAIQGTGAATNSLEVRDCLFQGCMSDIGGAGVSVEEMVDGLTIDACRFRDLTMSVAGTISISSTPSMTVSNCVFSDIDLLTGSGGCVSVIGGSCMITGNTMAFIHQAHSVGAAVRTYGATPTLQRNIIAHTSGTTAIRFENGGPVTGACNVFWDNADGIGYTPRPTDRIADPLFCNEDTRDLTLQPTSPCLPENSLGCGLIGALGQGCGSISVKPQSWGRTKSAYRSGEE